MAQELKTFFEEGALGRLQFEASFSNLYEHLFEIVVNNSIYHVSILPLVGHFEDKALAFAFEPRNELVSASGNMIV
ncbi:hypothetical protein DSO57_1014212 [Entomophthora muscae]|uniref:Uncharacterized protein n=1 Tax=Entomophthora muscae TaxID=34485 RepID=A0ACC2U3S8_9FUNG|nr:hypothetical protein DSO57_1014212 [Entomophthora muscae]